MTISEFLRTLTVEEEDRVLTRVMVPGDYFGPCLIGCAVGAPENAGDFYADRQMDWDSVCCARTPTEADWRDAVENRYDGLCDRFGIDAVNAAIRMRILRNRAQRTLGSVSGEPAVSSAGLGLVESTK